ncbi:MAG: hypothetical protein KAT68_13875 [Bacteroidales bacterium]|nr:hypothetical protein [Bacteroidales bacterium]
MNNYITAYIKIKDNKVWFNGTLLFEPEEDMTFPAFMKKIYKHNNTKYLKFFKMDKLSKLGFISSEILLKERLLSEYYNSDEIGIILANSNSTIDTDIEFYNTIKDKNDYFPSPSIFVYTLPNIMIGEISIKNKFRGENSFFVSKEYNSDFCVNYINGLFEKEKIKACLCGWIDYTADKYDAFMYVVESEKNTENNIIHNINNIKKIY